MLNFFDCDNKKYKTIKKVFTYVFIILSPIFLFIFIRWDILRVEYSLSEEEFEKSFIPLCLIIWIFFLFLFHYKKEIKDLNKLIEAGVLNDKLTKEDIKKLPSNELDELKTILENYKERTSNRKWIPSKRWWTINHNIKVINNCIMSNFMEAETTQKQPNIPQEELKELVKDGMLSPEFVADKVNKIVNIAAKEFTLFK